MRGRPSRTPVDHNARGEGKSRWGGPGVRAVLARIDPPGTGTPRSAELRLGTNDSWDRRHLKGVLCRAGTRHCGAYPETTLSPAARGSAGEDDIVMDFLHVVAIVQHAQEPLERGQV